MDSKVSRVGSRRRHNAGDKADVSVPQVEELVRHLLDDNAQERDIPARLESFADTLWSLRRVLLDSPAQIPSQDAFRRCGGFQALVAVLKATPNACQSFKVSNDIRKAFFQCLKALFEVLSGALADHAGNKKYFSSQIQPTGWIGLEKALSETGIKEMLNDSTTEYNIGKQQLFGILFAFLLNEENVATMFQTQKQDSSIEDDENEHPSASSQDSMNTPSKAVERHHVDLQAIRTRLETSLDSKEVTWNPEIAPTILRYWCALEQVPSSVTSAEKDLEFSIAVIAALDKIASLSEYNSCVLHSSGLPGMVLESLEQTSWHENELLCLKSLFLSLMKQGIPDLNDVAKFFRSATLSEQSMHLLLQAVEASNKPRHFLFDLSLHGSAAIEFPELKGTFPPLDSSQGYTFMTWIRVDQFDKACHTTIFGAFDVTQSCFLLLYIERESRQLVLQTSITASKPSVRFKSVKFRNSRWYHIAILHRRPVSNNSSQVSLFLDGVFCEETKCEFPRTASLAQGMGKSSDTSSAPKPRVPIQAFLGTPSDLSPRLGTGVLSSKLSLASAHLFGDVLTDELILIYQKLGPSYQGSFQDCLGSFQTYTSSAKLNLYNESLHPGKAGESVIASAIRSKAGKFNPEQKFLLNVSASNFLSRINQQYQSVSFKAIKEAIERYAANGIVVNGASPHIIDAIRRPYGTGVLTGGCIECNTHSLCSTAWRLSGFVSLALKMVESATVPSALVLSVKILFQLIKSDWRNSEAMERDNGYGMLAWLLRGKLTTAKKDIESTNPLLVEFEELESLKADLLKLILEFVGFDWENPRESLLINPLAYRVLLIDCNVWRRADITTQGVYYDQFTVFGLTSRHRNFNVKRLDRMRIMKKLLDALKGESIRKATLPILMEALKTIMRCTISADVLRSLALFITFSLHSSDTTPASLSDQEKNNVQSIRPTSGRASPLHQAAMTEKNISRFDLGISVLEMLAEVLTGELSDTYIRRFGRTVTNKWLLHLLAIDDSRVVIGGARILSRLLVVCGHTYTARFDENAKGFTVLCDRLRKWWRLDEIWTCCFSLLFGLDIAKVNMNQAFEAKFLLQLLFDNEDYDLKYPKVLTIITTMLEEALQTLSSENTVNLEVKQPDSLSGHTQQWKYQTPPTEIRVRGPVLIQEVLISLRTLYKEFYTFQELVVASSFTKELLKAVCPLLMKTTNLDLFAQELDLQASVKTQEGAVSRPNADLEQDEPVPVKKEFGDSKSASQGRPTRRSSSFVIVRSSSLTADHLKPFVRPLLPDMSNTKPSKGHEDLRDELVNLLVTIQLDQILKNKDFNGLGLFLKAPAGPLEYRSIVTSYIMMVILSNLKSSVTENPKLFWEPRILANICRFTQQAGEAVFEGWFFDGDKPLMDFVSSLLQYLQRPEVQGIKSVRLSSPNILALQILLRRLALLRLSSSQGMKTSQEPPTIFSDLMGSGNVLFAPHDQDPTWLPSFCFVLYLMLIDGPQPNRRCASEVWRMILVHKKSEITEMLMEQSEERLRQAGRDFTNLLRSGSAENLLDWAEEHRNDLNSIFSGRPEFLYSQLVQDENEKTEASARTRTIKRNERLQQLHLQDLAASHARTEHKLTTRNWSENIYNSEILKHQRTRQDQLDNRNFVEDLYGKQQKQFERLGILNDAPTTVKWQLDETEGRERMRLRLSPSSNTSDILYRPKRGNTDLIANSGSRPDTPSSIRRRATSAASFGLLTKDNNKNISQVDVSNTQSFGGEAIIAVEEDFEVVSNHNVDEEDMEDKNRKVMRSLQRGEQVEEVQNVSRIRGLEACACLLIIGKKALYFQDDLFQRADGEITTIDQVPKTERDPYTESLSGSGSTTVVESANRESEVRHWQWPEIISISKRHFLLRDVAIEIFFEDGRSYLLTAPTTKQRDSLFKSLIDRAYVLQDTKSPNEGTWRQNFLQNPGDNIQGLGSKFARVFNNASSMSSMSNIPTTKRWLKGEISNFHYLMSINTMAGRTFNDLTQYPVFPWVLADYTSDELDLDDPQTFRDLSKPMGCQTLEREAAFRERYKTFAEMSDDQTPPFHYGTHYSSAMIVTSFLIRLQPFVHSYLLLQGGRFDHADRLFHSMEKAWLSASRETMTDVRELTPEFFFLPDFLVNINHYDFGAKEGTGEVVNDVKLPPWAKGDPTIFIAKHREALESPYVTQNLHHWIDLIFGFKQRGDAALESTNVFHHLSYSGARDLDSIEDDLERQATIGIIHNFGQTPRQIFNRPHEAREVGCLPPDRLPIAFESFQMVPSPIFETRRPVSRLVLPPKQQKPVYCGPFQTYLRPDCSILAEWGYADQGIRFYSSDRKKMLGLYEQLHEEQVTTVLSVTEKALMTMSNDCTIIIWSVTIGSEMVELHPRGSLFGHRSPILVAAASRSFGTALTCSIDGMVYMWDLLRLSMLRHFSVPEPVTCAEMNDVNGHVLLCFGTRALLYTLNGQKLLDQRLGHASDEISSCAFFYGAADQWNGSEVIFTGHKNGTVTIWQVHVSIGGDWQLHLVRKLSHIDRARGIDKSFGSPITSILSSEKKLYTGDANGHVFEWNCLR